MEKKKLQVLLADNSRLLVQLANELALTKEDIISVVPPLTRGDQFKMIYYK